MKLQLIVQHVNLFLCMVRQLYINTLYTYTLYISLHFLTFTRIERYRDCHWHWESGTRKACRYTNMSRLTKLWVCGVHISFVVENCAIVNSLCVGKDGRVQMCGAVGVCGLGEIYIHN